MATAPVEEHAGTGDFLPGTGGLPSGTGEFGAHPGGFLSGVQAGLVDFAADFASRFLLLGRQEVADTLTGIEELSRIVDHLQVLGAHAADQHRLAQAGEDHRPTPGAAASGDGQWSAPGDEHRTAPGDEQWAAPGVASDGAGEVRWAVPGVASDGAGGEQWAVPGVVPAGAGGARSEFRDTADFLRGRLRISRAEATRRLRLAAATRPQVPTGGQQAPAPLEVLGAACGAGKLSGRAASVIRDAIERVRPAAGAPELEAMEAHLTGQAVEADEDMLRAVARRWETILDQDGQEPSEKLLRARQGVFLRGRRNGLHYLEIGATDEQFEHLATVMNTATNPRLPGTGPGSAASEVSGGGRAVQDLTADGRGADGRGGDGRGGDGPAGPHDPGSGAFPVGGEERPTRAQQLLQGLVGACRAALAGNGLPAAGGHRPQVMVTIDYRTLAGELNRAGEAVFARQIPARSIRRLACDADLIPLVLGGRGQVLDLGRAQRLFPAHLRRALVARDKGCAFPGCTIPATWCEAHHITPWEKGGTTTLTDGVLLCSHHHHRIHDGSWTVHSRHGIPWFLPPRSIDPGQKPQRNGYWTAGPPTGTKTPLLD